MSRALFLASSVALFTLTASCAHHQDVRPGEDGLNLVELQIEDKGDGFRDAMSQAEHYCDKRDKRAVVVSEDTKYVGSMDEKTYRKTRGLGKAAQVAGGAGVVFGGKNEQVAGGIVGIGGAAAEAAAGKGYSYTMKFRCK